MKKHTISKKILRQVAIINFLKAGAKSSTDLLKHLKSEGHSNSTSTLSNDIKSLKDSGFKIDDTVKGKYALFLDDDKELFSHFVKYQSLAIACQKILDIPKKFMQFIFFEPNALEFNLYVFDKMFKAIRNRKAVIFNHKKFEQGSEEKEYYFEPNVLKEYQNRWYVIGKTEKGHRTFSLERISNLKITDKPITIDIDNIEEKLETTIGVSFNEDTIKPKIVKLKIDNSQKEYIKTTPIFKHQEIIEENDTHFILKLFVGNTVELRQQILRYGRRIEVLEPEELRQQIFEEIKDLYKMYE